MDKIDNYASRVLIYLIWKVRVMTIIFKYLGISAFEITDATNEIKILTDPCISQNILCPVTVDDFEDIDIIVVSHGALDHMGDAVELQRKMGCRLVCGSDVRVHAMNNGVESEKITSMIWGDEVEVCGIKFKCLECRHLSFFQSEATGWIGGSIPLSFLIYLEDDARIYHVGDTSIFSDLKMFRELYNPDIVLIPVSGSPRVTGGYGHLPPYEAALATKWIGAEIAIPTHYDPEQEEDIKTYVESVELLAPYVNVQIMEPGEIISYDPKTSRVTKLLL